MATKISAFELVMEFPGLYTATKNNLRCTAISLRSGGLRLFSPVSGLSDVAKNCLTDIGEVEFLLAPNSYHNGGLAEYAAAYPNASLASSAGARERLQDRTGLIFNGLDALSAALPETTRLENPDGLKNGETWLIASTDTGWLWHVVDAFSAQKNTEGKIGN